MLRHPAGAVRPAPLRLAAVRHLFLDVFLLQVTLPLVCRNADGTVTLGFNDISSKLVLGVKSNTTVTTLTRVSGAPPVSPLCSLGFDLVALITSPEAALRPIEMTVNSWAWPHIPGHLLSMQQHFTHHWARQVLKAELVSAAAFRLSVCCRSIACSPSRRFGVRPRAPCITPACRVYAKLWCRCAGTAATCFQLQDQYGAWRNATAALLDNGVHVKVRCLHDCNYSFYPAVSQRHLDCTNGNRSIPRVEAQHEQNQKGPLCNLPFCTGWAGGGRANGGRDTLRLVRRLARLQRVQQRAAAAGAVQPDARLTAAAGIMAVVGVAAVQSVAPAAGCRNSVRLPLVLFNQTLGRPPWLV